MVDKAPGPHPSRACFMIRGETSRLSSPHGLAGQAACLYPGRAVSARSPECPEGAGTQSREGAPGCGEEARGAHARGAEGHREQAGQKARGARLWVQGFPASWVPGLSATRAAQSHVSPPCVFTPPHTKGLVFGYLFSILNHRSSSDGFICGIICCNRDDLYSAGRAQGKSWLPGPPGPCGLSPALLGHTLTPGLWAPSSAPLEPRGRCGQLGQQAGRLVCLTFCLHLSGTVGPLSFWSPLGGEMRGPRVPSACVLLWSRNSHLTGPSER